MKFGNLQILKELLRSRFIENDYNYLLGPLWSLLNPLILVSVLYFIFKDNFGSSIEGYPLYILSGVVTVNFVSNAVTKAATLLTSSQEVLLNTLTPPLALVFSELLFTFFRFGIELLLCLLLSLLWGFPHPGSFVSLFLLAIGLFCLAAGVSLCISLAFCVVRDVLYLWSFAVRILIFVTPVFYSLTEVPERTALLVRWLNPLTPFVTSFQSILVYHHAPEVSTICHCLLAASFFLIIGLGLFKTFHRSMIEQA